MFRRDITDAMNAYREVLKVRNNYLTSKKKLSVHATTSYQNIFNMRNEQRKYSSQNVITLRRNSDINKEIKILNDRKRICDNILPKLLTPPTTPTREHSSL